MRLLGQRQRTLLQWSELHGFVGNNTLLSPQDEIDAVHIGGCFTAAELNYSAWKGVKGGKPALALCLQGDGISFFSVVGYKHNPRNGLGEEQP